MKVAVMQPYFLPYLGYWQLMSAADIFVVYDNIKHTKKGWINRNRFLQNGHEALFTLPLKGDSDALPVCERELAPEFDRQSLLARFHGAYRRAPGFSRAFPVLERIVLHAETNLFRYLHHSILGIRAALGITSRLVVSSSLAFDPALRGEDKVLAICRELKAATYINAPGGVDLYSKERFGTNGIELKFIKPRPLTYKQFENDFVPGLSVLDVMMFNPPEVIADFLNSGYDLIEP